MRAGLLAVQSPRPPRRGRAGAAGAGLSKLNSMGSSSEAEDVTVSTYFQASPAIGRAVGCHHEGGRHVYGRLRSSRRIPRKEVIQPQLPLRLPCYDFTPVTDSTFDCSLPCGLGHRLRVFPASVV